MQDAVHQAYTEADVRSYRTYYDFDEFGRVVRQSAPKSTGTDRGTLVWSVTELDANDNVLSQYIPVFADASGAPVDPSTPKTLVAYNKMDQPTKSTEPDGAHHDDDVRRRRTHPSRSPGRGARARRRRTSRWSPPTTCWTGPPGRRSTGCPPRTCATPTRATTWPATWSPRSSRPPTLATVDCAGLGTVSYVTR